MSTATANRTAGLEVRSIDYVPLDERHGKVWHLGPLWFMSNAQIATLVVGVASVGAGGNLLWSLIAVVVGTLFGTLFMAFHSAQGPQLGLPQMIQSRPQFGYIGALLVWIFAYLQYAGFNIFNTILAGQSMNTVTHFSTDGWVVIVTAVSLLIALVGYDIIHYVERWLAFMFLGFFGIFTVGAGVVLHFPANAFVFSDFKATPFLLQFGVTAGYQISWAIYVSDYSRYLPPDISVARTSMWTYWGSAMGGIWLMGLGSLLAAVAGNSFGTGVNMLYSTGNKIVGGFGDAILVFSTLGLIAVTSLNMYGGSLTMISGVDSFHRVKPTLGVRIVTVGITTAIGLIGALTASANFLSNFENFLLLILYLFIPWTAVNLVDYYFVRRGHYAIAEIFNPSGLYGRWGWRGLVSYLAGFICMTPFFSTPSYSGFVANHLDGADLSLFVGLPVAGILYYVLCRATLDVGAEVRIAEAEREEVERLAHQHRSPDEAAGLA